jgi:hypothetical protein
LELDSFGNLSLIVNGSVSGSPIGFVGGTFANNVPTTVSYDVDTTTGAISNVAVQGSTADYSAFDSTTAFTGLGWAGLENAGGANENSAFVSNFQVGAIPEPGTYAMLASGVMALGAYQYRRRH